MDIPLLFIFMDRLTLLFHVYGKMVLFESGWSYLLAPPSQARGGAGVCRARVDSWAKKVSLISL